MLKTKIIEFNKEFKIENFNCSERWLSHLKKKKKEFPSKNFLFITSKKSHCHEYFLGKCSPSSSQLARIFMTGTVTDTISVERESG